MAPLGVAHHAAFEERGFLHVPAAFSAADAKVVSELVWELHAKKHGISQQDTSGWYTKSGSGARVYGPPPSQLKQSPPFRSLVRDLLATVDKEFGAGIWQLVARQNTTVFMNFPNICGSWTVPASWHSDFPQDPADPTAKVLYAFAFLENLHPGGGSTMILQGSSLRAQADDMQHCIGAGITIAETRSELLMETLAETDPWFKELFGPLAGGAKNSGNYKHLCGKETSERRVSRFMADEVISGGVSMKVVELIGDAGDIVFWDPRCLHSPSNNRNSGPRLAIRFRLDRIPTSSAEDKAREVTTLIAPEGRDPHGDTVSESPATGGQ